MPFITIEIPENIHFSFRPFALDLNDYLSQEIGISVEMCKTKLVKFSEVVVGHEDSIHTYARIQVEVLSGRERKKLLKLGKELNERFAIAIRSQNPDLICRIILDIREIDHGLLFTCEF